MKAMVTYNFDLAFVNHKISPFSKKIKLEPIPKTPTEIIVISAVSSASVLNRRRFWLKKANCKVFSDELEYQLQHVH